MTYQTIIKKQKYYINPFSVLYSYLNFYIFFFYEVPKSFVGETAYPVLSLLRKYIHLYTCKYSVWSHGKVLFVPSFCINIGSYTPELTLHLVF